MSEVIELIVPCYNEEKCIEKFVKEAKKIFDTYMQEYMYIITFIDDGSVDATLDMIKEMEAEYTSDQIRYISFSRNFGKESAIYAGLSNCVGDYVCVIDVDLQHPLSLIAQMIKAIKDEEYDCVTARRISRTGEPKIRSFFSQSFYHVFNKLTGMNLVPGGTDYRLMRKDVARAIAAMNERERFTKGMYSWVGYNNKWIEYENVERIDGESKWSTRGLIKYAFTGFSAFATTPLRGVVYLGVLTVICSLIWTIRLLLDAYVNGTNGTGFVTLLVVMLFLGGVIITILGMIGEYLAKIYIEVKGRPIYIEKESNIS